MTIDDQIIDEKLQYDINRKAAKVSALSSGKSNKYEYLTGEEILSSNQGQTLEQPKLLILCQEKLSKTNKSILTSRKKQTDDLKDLKVKQLEKSIEDKSEDEKTQSASTEILTL